MSSEEAVRSGVPQGSSFLLKQKWPERFWVFRPILTLSYTGNSHIRHHKLSENGKRPENFRTQQEYCIRQAHCSRTPPFPHLH